MKPVHNTSFMVGTTAISAEVYDDLASLRSHRIVEISHRSQECTDLIEGAVKEIREFFKVPESYTVLFAGSATDIWDVITNNLIKEKSFHFCNGNFSEAFYRCAKSWKGETLKNTVEWGELNDYSVDIPDDMELIALAYNETSSCVSCRADDIYKLRTAHPKKLLAVDITSIAGVASFDIENADIWYLSVQKGLGLPSGLGVMILSPAAVKKAEQMKKDRECVGCFQIHDLKEIMDEKFQTVQTPNILNIYLLKQQLTRWNHNGGIATIEKRMRVRATKIYAFFENHPLYTPFVKDKSHRSFATICITGTEKNIAVAHEKTEAKGIKLGTGYSKLKPTTFRLANYPALNWVDFEELFEILSENS